jgi:tryptophan-rich sensory protein
MSWFDKCAKVPWQPPNAVFQYVWPVLYTIYGVVMYLTWRRPQLRWVLLLGLALNLAWVPIYVWNVQVALGVLGAMISVAITTELALYKMNWKLGALFAPYVAWLLFAFSLNAYLAVKC